MSQNILTTNTVCVETIHSDSDLEIFSNRKISFDTPNMLVNELHFNKHIDNVVFGTTPPLTDTSYEYKVTTISQNEIDISQMGEYDLEMVDCLEVSSSQSFQDVSGTNKEHYVNLSASNNLIIRSENIFVKNEPFDDYVYRLVNNKNDPNPNTETTPSISIVPADRFNVTNFGAYFTNKINCNKISTENIYIDSSGSNEEPVLNINSRSAVNLQSLNILIDDSNTGSTVDLDTYLKSRLDESGMFTITIIPESGVDIGFTYDQSSVGKGFSNNYNSITAFNYIINFKIVPTGQTPTDGASTNVLDEVLTPAASDAQTYITYSNTPLTTYSLTNLNAGEFYDIYADVTNNFTNTTVYNVLTNGINIPTIEHVVINSITVIDEKQIEIRFIPHATQIANWNTYEKKVRFFVRLDNVNSVVNNDLLPDTSGFIEVDLSTASRSEQTYILDVTQYSSYPSANHIIVGSGFETNLHSFSIVSQHTSYPTSAFEMITPTPQSLTPFTFSAPSQPSNLQLDLDGENLFTWTQSSNTPTTTKITKIFYDIFRNGGSRLNSSDLENVGVCNSYTNVLQNIGLDLNTYRNVQQGIIPGTYQIQSYNLFGQRSGFATKQINTLSVGAPSFSTPTSANRSWRVSYSVNGANGSYYVSSNKGSATNSTYFHTTLDVGTHNVYVQVEDTAMRIRTNNSASITINQPVITIGDGSYVTGSTRQFSFPISLTSSSYSGASISSVSNAFSVTNCSAVSSTSNSIIVNSIIVQVNNSSTSINISFSTNAVDTYGYTSATASKTNLPISVSFDSVTVSCSSRLFSLSSTSGLSGFQWKLNGTDISGQTGTTGTTVTLADNEQYFGTISCSFTIVNSQGFSKTESSSINNPEPTLTSGSFTITGPSSYIYSFTSSYTEVEIKVTKSGSTVTDYSSSGSYSLLVKLQNNLGFSKWITVGTYSVTNPTAASFDFGTLEQTSITVNNINYGSNGNPNESPSSIKLYYSTSSFTITSLPGLYATLTSSETSKQINNLQIGTTYYFMIVKEYTNYGSIASNVYSTSTIVDARAFLTEVVDINASYTQTYRTCGLRYRFPFVDQSYITNNLNRVEIWISTQHNYFPSVAYENKDSHTRLDPVLYQTRLNEVYDESISHLYKIHTNSSLNVTQYVTETFTVGTTGVAGITFAVRVFLNDGTYQTFIPGTWTWNVMQIIPKSSSNWGGSFDMLAAPPTNYPIKFYVCRRFTIAENYSRKIIYIDNIANYPNELYEGKTAISLSTAIGKNQDSSNEWDIFFAKRVWSENHGGTSIGFKFISNQIRVGEHYAWGVGGDIIGYHTPYYQYHRPETLNADEVLAALSINQGTITVEF